uniref:Uncharacterized protein n=1 Tax=Rhizophora mucronata TaxID=61149 RepID=A0A2P2QVK2_RHIMU
MFKKQIAKSLYRMHLPVHSCKITSKEITITGIL